MNEETLFSDAMIMSPPERAQFLAVACNGDDELRRRVEALLAAHDPADNFLESPIANSGVPVSHLIQSRRQADGDSTSERLGTQIGPYRLLEQIGEGGFGVVFMAEQLHPVRRKVAVKIVKPGMDTRQVIARFEAERQALAIMDHPNIARVFDGGATASGRPYFVMELVRGIPITDFCDQDHTPIRGRLELFIHVCQAVQHAHQKGIIHRDLKPSNILVTLHDGIPVVKVIDFGIAKATGQQLTDKTLFTSFAQFIGTPMYMSPEQAALSGLDVDTRTDIYALGVLLYELLTGQTPFDKEKMRTAAHDEIRRIIREEEPLRPSTRLTTLGRDSATVFVNRGCDAKQLSRMLHGELDWIVIKTLEKDRNRRYETANGLSRDIQRYLRDEPVEARPPSVAYRLRKLVARNKGRVATASFLAIVLLAAMVGTIIGLIEVVKQKNEAKQQAAIAQAVSDFLQLDLLDQADVNNQDVTGAATRDPDIKVRTLLDRAAHKIDERFAGQPLTEAAIRTTIAKTYRQIGFPIDALPHADRAAALYESALDPTHVHLRQAQVLQAGLAFELGEYDRTELLCRKLLAVNSTSTPADDNRLQALLYQALVARARGQHDRSAILYENVLRETIATYGENHPSTQSAKHGLAVVYHHRDQFDRAEKYFREVVDWRSAHLGRDHRDTQNSLHGLAACYSATGQVKLAEPLFLELIETASRLRPDHNNVLNYKTGLALMFFRQGEYVRAESYYREVLSARMAKSGADHPDTLGAINNLAAALNRQGKMTESMPLLRQAVDAARNKFGLAHPDTQLFVSNLIITLEDMNQHDLALPLCQELIHFWNAQPTPSPISFRPRLTPIGKQLIKQSKYPEAELIFRTEFAMCDKLNSAGWTPSAARVHLSIALLGQDKTQEAVALLETSYQQLSRQLGNWNGQDRQSALECLDQLVKWLETQSTIHPSRGFGALSTAWRIKHDALRDASRE